MKELRIVSRDIRSTKKGVLILMDFSGAFLAEGDRAWYYRLELQYLMETPEVQLSEAVSMFREIYKITGDQNWYQIAISLLYQVLLVPQSAAVSYEKSREERTAHVIQLLKQFPVVRGQKTWNLLCRELRQQVFHGGKNGAEIPGQSFQLTIKDAIVKMTDRMNPISIQSPSLNQQRDMGILSYAAVRHMGKIPAADEKHQRDSAVLRDEKRQWDSAVLRDEKRQWDSAVLRFEPSFPETICSVMASAENPARQSATGKSPNALSMPSTRSLVMRIAGQSVWNGIGQSATEKSPNALSMPSTRSLVMRIAEESAWNGIGQSATGKIPCALSMHAPQSLVMRIALQPAWNGIGQSATGKSPNVFSVHTPQSLVMRNAITKGDVILCGRFLKLGLIKQDLVLRSQEAGAVQGCVSERSLFPKVGLMPALQLVPLSVALLNHRLRSDDIREVSHNIRTSTARPFRSLNMRTFVDRINSFHCFRSIYDCPVYPERKKIEPLSTASILSGIQRIFRLAVFSAPTYSPAAAWVDRQKRETWVLEKNKPKHQTWVLEKNKLMRETWILEKDKSKRQIWVFQNDRSVSQTSIYQEENLALQTSIYQEDNSALQTLLFRKDNAIQQKQITYLHKMNETRYEKNGISALSYRHIFLLSHEGSSSLGTAGDTLAMRNGKPFPRREDDSAGKSPMNNRDSGIREAMNVFLPALIPQKAAERQSYQTWRYYSDQELREASSHSRQHKAEMLLPYPASATFQRTGSKNLSVLAQAGILQKNQVTLGHLCSYEGFIKSLPFRMEKGGSSGSYLFRQFNDRKLFYETRQQVFPTSVFPEIQADEGQQRDFPEEETFPAGRLSRTADNESQLQEISQNPFSVYGENHGGNGAEGIQGKRFFREDGITESGEYLTADETPKKKEDQAAAGSDGWEQNMEGISTASMERLSQLIVQQQPGLVEEGYLIPADDMAQVMSLEAIVMEHLQISSPLMGGSGITRQPSGASYRITKEKGFQRNPENSQHVPEVHSSGRETAAFSSILMIHKNSHSPERTRQPGERQIAVSSVAESGGSVNSVAESGGSVSLDRKEIEKKIRSMEEREAGKAKISQSELTKEISKSLDLMLDYRISSITDRVYYSIEQRLKQERNRRGI